MTTAAPMAERIRWLDGVRGGAALFVVLHHIWLQSWPFFPENHAPWWLGWLLYGHLAVAVFIVVSGFSLALAPLRRGGELVGGTRRFIRRRAWRILPAYWAALVLSMLFMLFVLRPQTTGGEAVRTFLVHGALLQDVVGNVAPNGVFWSIAIEWQIYFVFPLILLVALRSRMAVAIALTALVVIIVHEVATSVSALDQLNHFSPQFLALFAFGVLAAWAAQRDLARWVKPAAGVVSLAAFVAMVALALSYGSAWMTEHWFWVDMLFGTSVAGALLLTATTQRSWRSATLQSRPAVFIGSFSYSLYLIHAPVLETLQKFVVRPLALPALANFAVLMTLALPLVLTFCWGFCRLFEKPFLERRDLPSLRTLPVLVWLADRRAAQRAGKIRQEPA